MVLDEQTAKKLEPLVNPLVEKALILLLMTAITQAEEEVYGNPHASDAELRMFQGKRMIINELKEYKKRINDGIKREKDGSQYTGPE